MNTEQLESKWKLIVQSGNTPDRSLRIDPLCIAELYLALDLKGERFLILQVPSTLIVPDIISRKKYLTLEWHEETRFILIGLHDKRFADLFNDLIMSLYNRIKDMANPEDYKNEFISCFNKWSEFFDDSFFNKLSDLSIKGLIGELSVLLWNLNNVLSASINDILLSWQGPYGKAHDFVFSSYNLEVKTKNTDDVYVQISSEYQLEAETGKAIKLGVVNVIPSESGINLQNIIETIKSIILSKNGDLSIFTRALFRTGIGQDYAVDYSDIKFEIVDLTVYQCDAVGFPKLIVSGLPDGISNVKYYLNTTVIQNFIIEINNFEWNSRNSLFTAGRF